MSALLTLEHADGAVVVAPHTGGAIVSFQWRGAQVLRPTPPDVVAAADVRRHACYPLVPYSNRIAGGLLTFAGRAHQLALNFGDHPHAIHGVGWQRAWTVEDATRTTARLRYEHRPSGSDPDTLAWPWPFQVTQWLQLTDDEAGGVTLRMRMTLANMGQDTFPFGLGWHPFFPCERGTRLAFAAQGLWETDPTVLPVRHVPATEAYSFASPRAVGTAVLDNVYTGWSGTAELRYEDAARATVMRGDTASPFFVAYIPPHHAFLAIEPVTQMTDAFNRAERGERDTGARLLAPGEAFSCTMEIGARGLS